MADIELVIKIPEGLKKDFESEQWTALSCMEMKDALEKATPLPKGHGRLGDLSKIYVELNEAQIEGTEEYEGLGEAKQIICAAPTIIEAESENKMLVCPACGLDVHSHFKTCPRCGAKMIEPYESFLKKCLEGTAKLSELGDYVERWHDENNGDMSLREFLGLTEAEYNAWGKNGDDIFAEFLSARKESQRYERK